MQRSIINPHTHLQECPFCHEPGFLFKEELWNGSHGYHGNYDYYVGCDNDKCYVRPKTKAIDDIYRDSELAIQESIKRWNNR